MLRDMVMGLLVLIFFTTSVALTQSSGTPPPTKTLQSGELILKYKEIGIYNIELVYNLLDSSVAVRLQSETSLPNKDELDILKAEVVHLISTKDVTKLGKTGFSFRFKGKYPIWGPYTAVGPGYRFHCLMFAERGSFSITDRGIRALGRNGKIGYYPYPEIIRR